MTIVPLPKCCACGCDVLACLEINAHSANERRTNRHLLRGWRDKQKAAVQQKTS